MSLQEVQKMNLGYRIKWSTKTFSFPKRLMLLELALNISHDLREVNVVELG